jgi:hypothetical protein
MSAILLTEAEDSRLHDKYRDRLMEGTVQLGDCVSTSKLHTWHLSKKRYVSELSIRSQLDKAG